MQFLSFFYVEWAWIVGIMYNYCGPTWMEIEFTFCNWRWNIIFNGEILLLYYFMFTMNMNQHDSKISPICGMKLSAYQQWPNIGKSAKIHYHHCQLYTCSLDCPLPILGPQKKDCADCQYKIGYVLVESPILFAFCFLLSIYCCVPGQAVSRLSTSVTAIFLYNPLVKSLFAGLGFLLLKSSNSLC